MKPLLRTMLLVCAVMAMMTCKSTTPAEELPKPQIIFGEAPAIPAGGTDEGRLAVTLVNAEHYRTEILCDGEVINKAVYRSPDAIIFTATANNTYSERTGWIEVFCGDVNLRTDMQQASADFLPAIDGRTGWFELPAKPRNDDLICYAHDKLPSDGSKRNYSFCFSAGHHASLWVAYPLHDCYCGGTDRTNQYDFDWQFAADTGDNKGGEPAMQANISAAYYTGGHKEGTQYSRGHQLPSADRTCSHNDNVSTFFATNMTPQLQSLNGGAWARLESLARENWICRDTLYVVTGAIFDEGGGYAYDNQGRGKACSIPTHYYKVLLRTKNGATGKSVAECSADELQCIGFVLKHDNTRASQRVYTTDACSVTELEEMTGETFFVNVPNAPKSACDTKDWPGLTKP